MAVEIQLDPSTQPQQIPEAPKPIMEIELNARRTMDGDVMVFDHADIDIIIMPIFNLEKILNKRMIINNILIVNFRLIFKMLMKILLKMRIYK